MVKEDDSSNEEGKWKKNLGANDTDISLSF